jgi:hypothetical protein
MPKSFVMPACGEGEEVVEMDVEGVLPLEGELS